MSALRTFQEYVAPYLGEQADHEAHCKRYVEAFETYKRMKGDARTPPAALQEAQIKVDGAYDSIYSDVDRAIRSFAQDLYRTEKRGFSFPDVERNRMTKAIVESLVQPAMQR